MTYSPSEYVLDFNSLTEALTGRYVLERELGRGGMATVYLARDLKHGRQVALKVLRPDLAVALGTERFLQEIRISARLDHPHILTLIDSGETAGWVWYVLPYVRGESLRDRLIRERQLPIEECLRIATQVAGALDYAHRQGLVHRDIKPENILLHEGEAVVADFGIALALREAGGERLTGTGLSLGTPHYMSPEQATADRELDARSDVYALAAVVYEMLAGEPPHTGPTAQAVIAKLLSERPTRLRTTRDSVPEAVDAAVDKALARLPTDRFGSAGDFARALGAPGGAPSPARRRAPVGLALGVGVLVIAGMVLARPWRRADGPATVPADVASVAVLPFDNLSGNPGDQYLSDGMTEEVISQLVQVRDLKVISRTSTDALKGTGLTLRQIADTLGVRHIVEGSVRHAGNRIRVVVDLIDATTDAHVWASRYDRDLTDVFAVQSEIARNVADSLVRTVGMRPVVPRVTATTAPGAYEAYLAGRSLLYRRTREGLLGAREKFEEAIAKDSMFAPAYASLAAVHVLSVLYVYRGVDPYDSYRQALAIAERAIAVDPNHAEAYAIHGLAQTRTWGPFDRAGRDFDRALSLSPNSADVRQWHAQYLSRRGLRQEAFEEAARAVTLDPLSPGVRLTLLIEAMLWQRYDVAIEEAARVLATEPGLMRARYLQALSQLLSGRASACAAQRLGPYAGVRAMCLHSLGRTQDAAALVDSLKRAIAAGTAGDSTTRPVIPVQSLAQYYAWTGDAGQSLAWLERAYRDEPEGEDYRVLLSHLYDKVRNDSRWKAGVERAHRAVWARVGN